MKGQPIYVKILLFAFVVIVIRVLLFVVPVMIDKFMTPIASMLAFNCFELLLFGSIILICHISLFLHPTLSEAVRNRTLSVFIHTDRFQGADADRRPKR